MSKLIPNLGDLRRNLTDDESAADAREFADELAKAESSEEINAKVDTLIDQWLEMPDDGS